MDVDNNVTLLDGLISFVEKRVCGGTFSPFEFLLNLIDFFLQSDFCRNQLTPHGCRCRREVLTA
jgi:hypothetical protein